MKRREFLKYFSALGAIPLLGFAQKIPLPIEKDYSEMEERFVIGDGIEVPKNEKIMRREFFRRIDKDISEIIVHTKPTGVYKNGYFSNRSCALGYEYKYEQGLTELGAINLGRIFAEEFNANIRNIIARGEETELNFKGINFISLCRLDLVRAINSYNYNPLLSGRISYAVILN